MGGCFPCFGSSNGEQDKNGVKEVVKKDSSVKDGSVPQSHHLSRVSSGKSSPNSLCMFLFLVGILLGLVNLEVGVLWFC